MKTYHSRTPKGAVQASATLAISVLLLSGCANMSGLDGGTEYGCKAPQGVRCDSVSGTYYNALQNNLPAQRRHRTASTAIETQASGSMPSAPNSPTAATIVPGALGAGAFGAIPPTIAADPLRSRARILRLWFKPWEDTDHDLYDQGYVYVRIDDGHWLIEHAQQRIRDAYAPIKPPRAASALPNASSKPADPRGGGADTADGDSGAGSAPFPAASKSQYPLGDLPGARP